MWRAAGGGAAAPVGSLVAVGQLFLDERGQALRVTWHAEAGVVVLSIWREEGECVGTVRLSPTEARRLAAFLEPDLVRETPP